MNDFTKEELRHLRIVYKAFCIEDDDDGVERQLTSFEMTVLQKLDSMIENYNCIHQSNEPCMPSLINGVPIGVIGRKCNLCGELF